MVEVVYKIVKETLSINHNLTRGDTDEICACVCSFVQTLIDNFTRMNEIEQ